ncbi:hypothetical protein ASPZODRAFT_13475 [Penicilliopsis zonata CBS 506.65]|uniref:Uncharacterized protein n=1 Tax=Penicilliopsis zonata CBS 506.65 TaxID=1073090 RepID=A0A1L9STI3_9EURO|nr:hypothetical protein ASPZODRAFT_13475 [Penicilliopsis zonata CBS 506.65]OJJ50393.1 hypothetical protein ASPZODRAFT_13475 [Penicilliopsis zonata CBS 506.65]
MPRSQEVFPKDTTPQKMVLNVLHQIREAEQDTEIIYEQVEPEKGGLVYRFLIEDEEVERLAARLVYNSFSRVLRIKVMPPELHDAHQRWAINSSRVWCIQGLLNLQESNLLGNGVGTTFAGFTGAYTGSAAEPDFFFRPDTSDFPTIVIESGWEDSMPHLRADKDLWMLGNQSVQLVILLGWTVTGGGTVGGRAEIWRRTAAGGGDGLTSNEISIFPTPSPGLDSISFTKGQLFGQAGVTAPQTILSLEVQMLREIIGELYNRLSE